jgi:hypothetical protein
VYYGDTFAQVIKHNKRMSRQRANVPSVLWAGAACARALFKDVDGVEDSIYGIVRLTDAVLGDV